MTNEERQQIEFLIESIDIDLKAILQARRKITRRLDAINNQAQAALTRLQSLEAIIEGHDS